MGPPLIEVGAERMKSRFTLLICRQFSKRGFELSGGWHTINAVRHHVNLLKPIVLGGSIGVQEHGSDKLHWRDQRRMAQVAPAAGEIFAYLENFNKSLAVISPPPGQIGESEVF